MLIIQAIIRVMVCVFIIKTLLLFNYLKLITYANVSINKKKGYVAVLYRSPSQNNLEFDNFILKFQMMLSNINSSNTHFLLFLVILMQGQIIGGKVILKQVTDRKSIFSQLLMVSNN